MRKLKTTKRKQKDVKKLSQSLKSKHSDSYAICGRNAVLDGIKSGRIFKILISSNVERSEKTTNILEEARKYKVAVEEVGKKEIEKLVGSSVNHQGVVALCKKAKEVSLVDFLHSVEDRESVCFVLLTEIEYEQNLGAIYRTSDGAGVDGLILSNRIKNTDSVVVRRISMGASENTNIFVQNIFIAIRMLKEHGFTIIGVESEGSGLYVNSDLSGKIALVFGGEDKSLSQAIIDTCDDVVEIPMLGSVTSLNVSVSVAVTVYERLRQIINKYQKKD